MTSENSAKQITMDTGSPHVSVNFVRTHDMVQETEVFTIRQVTSCNFTNDRVRESYSFTDFGAMVDIVKVCE